MLEHPEIQWIERTGYPSWMQERRPGDPWVEMEESELWQEQNPIGS